VGVLDRPRSPCAPTPSEDARAAITRGNRREVDEEGDVESHNRIDRVVLQRLVESPSPSSRPSRLDEGRVGGRGCGASRSRRGCRSRSYSGVPVRQRGQETARDPGEVRPERMIVDKEADPMVDTITRDERLHLPESPPGEEQDEEGVQRRDQDPVHQGEPESSCSPIADPRTSARSHAAIATSHRIHSAALTAGGTGRGTPARDPSRRTSPSRAERALQQDGHQVRHQEDPDQRVAVSGARRDVGGPVPRVHVPDRHEVRGPATEETPGGIRAIPGPSPTSGLLRGFTLGIHRTRDRQGEGELDSPPAGSSGLQRSPRARRRCGA